MIEGKRGSSYSALKKLGLRPGEKSHPEFQLEEHEEKNLSPYESAELLANHFSAVSQEYAALNIDNLPTNIKTYLSRKDDTAPMLSVTDVYLKLVKSKKPNSYVPGDLPKKVVQRYAAELAHPVSVIIYNNILQLAT